MQAAAPSSVMPSLPPPPSRLVPGSVPLSSCSLPADGGSSDPDELVRQAEREPHTWTACPGCAFKVRHGPSYKSKRKKAPSASALYEVFAVDAFSSESKLAHIGRVAALPDEPSPPLPSGCELPPYAIINWMVPNYPPSGLLTTKRTDGPGWNLVLYCRLSEEVRAQLAAPTAEAEDGAPAATPPAAGATTPTTAAQTHTAAAPAPATALGGGRSLEGAVELLRRFIHPTEGQRLRGERLKCIMGLADLEETGLGFVMKQMIRQYNFKPFLSRTASSVYIGPRYFEIDIDIHTWGHAALSAFNTVKERLPYLVPRVAVCVEAEADEEMPERVLAGLYLTHMDPASAPMIDAHIAAYLTDPNHHVPPLPKTKGRSAMEAVEAVEATDAAELAEARLDGDRFDYPMYADSSPPPTERSPGEAEAVDVSDSQADGR